MTTKIYIPVQGTCTAGPDDNLFNIVKEIGEGKRGREFSKKLNRDVTGGGTVLWIKSDSGIYMIDTGDIDDREVLQNSLEKIEKEERVDPIKSVKSIYHPHSHLDHNANNDLFPNAYWMVDEKDDLVELMMGEKDNDAYNNFRQWYEGHRERGITSDKFTRYQSNDHAGKPEGLKLIDTPGHAKVHKTPIIKDKEIVIINLETGEETITDKITFTGDCLCDERYLNNFLSTDPNIEKTAIYGNAVPTEQWTMNDEKLRNKLDAQNLKSMEKIVDEGRKGLFIFGHGGVY